MVIGGWCGIDWKNKYLLEKIFKVINFFNCNDFIVFCDFLKIKINFGYMSLNDLVNCDVNSL